MERSLLPATLGVASDVALSVFLPRGKDDRVEWSSSMLHKRYDDLLAQVYDLYGYAREDEPMWSERLPIFGENLDKFIKASLWDAEVWAKKSTGRSTVLHPFGDYSREDSILKTYLSSALVTRFALSFQSALMDAYVSVYRGHVKWAQAVEEGASPVHQLTYQVRELWKVLTWVPYLVNLSQPDMAAEEQDG